MNTILTLSMYKLPFTPDLTSTGLHSTSPLLAPVSAKDKLKLVWQDDMQQVCCSCLFACYRAAATDHHNKVEGLRDDPLNSTSSVSADNNINASNLPITVTTTAEQNSTNVSNDLHVLMPIIRVNLTFNCSK